MIRVADGTLITMDADSRVLAATDLWIDGSRIVHMGPWDRAADTVISAKGRMVMPGLVQPHIHLCQSLFRGLADDLELLDWLRLRIWPLEAAHDADSLYASARLGVAELLAGGTTTILDMETVHHTESAFLALAESGIRAVAGKCLMDEPHPLLSEPMDTALRESQDLRERWHGYDGGRLQYAFAPRFALSVTDRLWRQLAAEALRTGTLVHTHVAENRREVEEITARRGATPLHHLDQMGLTDGRLVAAHGVWLTAAEQALAARRGVGLVHCPSSNLKLGSGIAPVAEWQRRGIAFGIGADGAPCNNGLDGFWEMRLAGLLPKPAFGAAAVSAQSVVHAATMGGARVLGLEDRIGSLEVGKEADVIVLDWQGVPHRPAVFSDPYSQLVYQTHSRDVMLTMVAGRVLYAEGRIKSMDRAAVVQDAEQAVQRDARRAGLDLAGATWLWQ